MGQSFRISALSLALFLTVGCIETQAANEDIDISPLVTAETRPENSQSPDRYAAFAAVVARHQAMSDRVARISRRLRVANAPLCRQTRLDVGLVTHQLTDYPAGIRPLAMHFMDIGENGRFIRTVIPNSPAEDAQLKPGQKILSGWPVDAEAALVTDQGKVELRSDKACVAPAIVINAEQPNASTDGREILLSTALVEDVTDDTALAFIIAHEMAHLLRGHTPDGPRWLAELQADSDALTLLRNAGYNVIETVAEWEAGVEAHRDTQAMSVTHPPLEIRLKNLQAALTRLQAGPAGFKDLEY